LQVNRNAPLLGFLFDVDGCLTLPLADDVPRLLLDIPLLDQIYALHQRQIPRAFVTGRSASYLKRQYAQYDRVIYQNIPAYVESGLVKWINGEIQILESARYFSDLRKTLIETLDLYCVKNHYYFEPNVTYDHYPEHGEMWLENKLIQLSVTAGKNVPPSKLHEITFAAWKDFLGRARFLPHRFGIDVIPLGWSKAKATAHFISTLEPGESTYQWFVLGDSESDREMTKGLSCVHFVSTQQSASEDVWRLLKRLGMV
jgi:HAD superfamily hydrolase (TIGR01484 family)